MTSPSSLCLDIAADAEDVRCYPELHRVLRSLDQNGGGSTFGKLANWSQTDKCDLWVLVTRCVHHGLARTMANGWIILTDAGRMEIGRSVCARDRLKSRCCSKMPWTVREDELVRYHWQRGASDRETSTIVGRTAGAIERRRQVIGAVGACASRDAALRARTEAREADARRAKERADEARRAARAARTAQKEAAEAAKKRADEARRAERATRRAAADARREERRARKEAERRARKEAERETVRRAGDDPVMAARTAKAWRRLEEGRTLDEAAYLEGWGSAEEMVPHLRSYGRRVLHATLSSLYRYDDPRLRGVRGHNERKATTAERQVREPSRRERAA